MEEKLKRGQDVMCTPQSPPRKTKFHNDVISIKDIGDKDDKMDQ